LLFGAHFKLDFINESGEFGVIPGGADDGGFASC